MEKSRNILVIGGDSYIAQKFIETNKMYYNIYSISRVKTNNQNEYIIKNLFNLSDSKFMNMDVVINFAAIVHQPKTQDKDIYELINYRLPIFLAKMALSNRCYHYIQLSTIAVYGKAKLINDNTTPFPVNYYGEYKLKADIELSKLSGTNFQVTSLRPSMVYGGKNVPGNINSLIKIIKKNIPLPFKEIYNKRQYLNVNNLTQAIKGIIDQRKQDIIILADEESISTYELIDIVSRTLNKDNNCFKFNLLWKFMRVIKPEITRKLVDDLIIENTYSFNELGIKHPHSIEDGIKEMLLNI